jgi:hypothetical protein
MSNNPSPKQEGNGTESAKDNTGNNDANSTGDDKRAKKLKKLYELTDYRWGSRIPDD